MAASPGPLYNAPALERGAWPYLLSLCLCNGYDPARAAHQRFLLVSLFRSDIDADYLAPGSRQSDQAWPQRTGCGHSTDLGHFWYDRWLLSPPLGSAAAWKQAKVCAGYVHQKVAVQDS